MIRDHVHSSCVLLSEKVVTSVLQLYPCPSRRPFWKWERSAHSTKLSQSATTRALSVWWEATRKDGIFYSLLLLLLLLFGIGFTLEETWSIIIFSPWHTSNKILWSNIQITLPWNFYDTRFTSKYVVTRSAVLLESHGVTFLWQLNKDIP